MKHYSLLILGKRYGIYSLLKTGQTQSKIAEVVGVHKSTINRELKRNRGGRGYRSKQANAFAEDRHRAKVRFRIDGNTWAFVEQLLRKEWSPEQISGWMKENIESAMKRLLYSISDQVYKITSDNGKEFGNHEKIAKGLECIFYFTHAYSSWERGTNENTNGLIRQYFPKKGTLEA